MEGKGEDRWRPGLVSIITPVYNAEAVIGETIESVRAQTWTDWEWILVDDASTDRSADILRAAASTDPRIRPILSGMNRGPAAARQTGVDAARGRYVAFVDSDDLWEPTKLEKQIRALRSSTAGLSFTSFRRMDERGERLGPPLPVPARMEYTDLLGNTAIATSTVVIDRGRTGAFVVPAARCDDFCLWAKILEGGVAAESLPEPLMRYRVVSGSWSRNKFRNAWWMWLSYRQGLGFGPFKSLKYFLRYAFRGLGKHLRY